MRKQYSKKNTILKATIRNIIVAFVYVAIFVGIITLLFSSKISKAISLINIVSSNTSKKVLSEVKIDLEHNKLETYPEIGDRYGTLTIESLGVNLPIYYGDSLSILRNGVGHSSFSYFPGEGGSIIYMAHNTRGFLRKLPEIQVGAKIKINTVYGDYTYTVNETKIIHQTEEDALYLQKDKEVLILYTCYPVNSIGHATHRFVTYSSLD